MNKGKKGKNARQLLIHQIDEKVYNAVVQLATKEKRSLGKQAEYMLSKFIEQSSHQQTVA